MFIDFEGPDRSGKTTQVRLLEGKLVALGHEVLVTREPGGTPIAESIRNLVLNPYTEGMDPWTETLLYLAARANNTARVIIPALEAGKIIISDRYQPSTKAYQGYGRGLDIEVIDFLGQVATQGVEPDLVVLLDIEPAVGLRRELQQENLDRLEREAIEYHLRVRQGYLAMSREDLARWMVLDARRGKNEIHQEIMNAVLKVLEGEE